MRGELLWPGALITAVAWAMLAVATFLSATVLAEVERRLADRRRRGARDPGAGARLRAAHDSQRASRCCFPAWVPLGNQRPRGLDAMGQRLIMLGGTWLLLIVMALPGAIAGGIVWFALERFVGPAGADAGRGRLRGDRRRGSAAGDRGARARPTSGWM